MKFKVFVSFCLVAIVAMLLEICLNVEIIGGHTKSLVLTVGKK